MWRQYPIDEIQANHYNWHSSAKLQTQKPLFIEGKTTNSTITEGNILATIPLNAVRIFHKGSSNSNIHNQPQIIR
jgi:hypothetical protein